MAATLEARARGGAQARPARTPTISGRAFRPGVLYRCLALAALLAGAPLSAAPLHTVGFLNGYAETGVSSATPLRRDTSYSMVPSNGTGVATGHGAALLSRVAANHVTDVVWASGLSGAFYSGTFARTTTTDFVITGPAGPSSVSATLNFRLKASFSVTGGFPNHGAQEGSVAVALAANLSSYPNSGIAQTSGEYHFSNAGPYSGGCLTGLSGSSIDVPIALAGNFPVNSPFTVTIRVQAGGQEYGNVFCNVGQTTADAGGTQGGAPGAGLSLESVSGQILTLPAGYTVNAPSWGIVDNGFTTAGAGETAMPDRLALDVAGANPFSGQARLTLTLPRAGRIRVAVYDAAGRTVRTLANEWSPAGRRELAWDGRNADGASARAGLYFVRAEGDGTSATLRLARVR